MNDDFIDDLVGWIDARISEVHQVPRDTDSDRDRDLGEVAGLRKVRRHLLTLKARDEEEE